MKNWQHTLLIAQNLCGFESPIFAQGLVTWTHGGAMVNTRKGCASDFNKLTFVLNYPLFYKFRPSPIKCVADCKIIFVLPPISGLVSFHACFEIPTSLTHVNTRSSVVKMLENHLLRARLLLSGRKLIQILVVLYPLPMVTLTMRERE